MLPEGRAVLDLCCGTGLILNHLTSLGYPAYGVDESAEMLAVARRNAPHASLQQADMAEFHWDIRFDAVVSFYNSLNHARSLDHLRATLMNAGGHLHAGGYLLFDYALPEAFETAWEWREEVVDEGGIRTLHYRYERATGEAICVINRRDRIRQLAFQPEQIHDALYAANLPVLCETRMAGSGPREGRRLVLAQRK